ncbi:MAG: beta-lactamase family protein [Proteobacteria bacterium]|nr:beta-lactamase family protein [Pseudomonadota bacterium]
MRFATLAFVLLCLSAGPATAGGKTQSFGQVADAYFRAKAAQGAFSGSVIIAYDGKPLLRRAYGLADRERNIASHIDDEYQIASTTKTFTAVTVGKLVAEGRLSFDDPISRYLPDAPAAWRDITVAHLLSHESGIPEYSATTNSFRALMRAQRTPQEIVALVDRLPLSFPPGSKYRYTNSDFVLLGLIVERVSGKPYETFVRETLLDPLRLGHTGFTHAQTLMPSRAHGYMKGDDGGWENAFYIDPSMLYAAGSMYSTVDDLLAWDQALYGGKVLPPALGEQMRKSRGHEYGLGFFVDAVDGHAFVGHAGSLPGFETDFQRFQDAPLTFIILSNTYRAPAEKMTRELATIYFKRCAKSHGRRCAN